MKENMDNSAITELEQKINEIASAIESLKSDSSRLKEQDKNSSEKFKELIQSLKEAQPSPEKDENAAEQNRAASDVKEITQALKEARPSWEKDGTGARGQPTKQKNLNDNDFSKIEIPKFDFKQTVPETGKLEEDPTPTQEIIQGGGVGQNCVGLNLYSKTNEDGDQEVWIGAGTIAGQVPDDFDSIEGKFIENSGNGFVWAKVEIDENFGTIVSVEVENGENIPNNTNADFYYPLGAYEQIESDDEGKIRFTVDNYDCGSVDVTICRNWFRSTAPFYGVSFSR
jgi:hypothetical protein